MLISVEARFMEPVLSVFIPMLVVPVRDSLGVGHKSITLMTDFFSTVVRISYMGIIHRCNAWKFSTDYILLTGHFTTIW